MKKMRCFLKRPESGWYSTCCSTSLSNLQRIVGGYIETVTFPELGVMVICNEEGRLLGDGNPAKVIEELADVENMTVQLRIIYDEDGMVDYWKQAKMNRLAHRMEGDAKC